MRRRGWAFCAPQLLSYGSLACGSRIPIRAAGEHLVVLATKGVGMAQPVNVCRRVVIHAGWIAKLQGRRSTHAAIQREIESLNADGYRVVWIHPDEWGWLQKP